MSLSAALGRELARAPAVAVVAEQTLRRAAALASPALHAPEMRCEADEVYRELQALVRLAEARGAGALPPLPPPRGTVVAPHGHHERAERA